MPEKLFKKDFTLVVIGQIISLFGNNILRFALPLYLLRQTGSAKLFGTVSALAILPLIVLSPFGGIIADRFNKRNIMVILDFLTALVIGVYAMFYQHSYFVPILVITLMILYGIQATYAPTVQASIPFLVGISKIVQANAVVNMVSSLALLLGPAIGGMIFGIYGIYPLLLMSVICFLISAFIELFIRIPFEKTDLDAGFITIVRNDFKESINYIFKEKKILIKVTAIICLLNLFLSSSLSIGFPIVLIKVLGVEDQLLGYFQGGVVIGSVLGGVLASIVGSKIRLKYLYLLLGSFSIIMLPIPLMLLYSSNQMLIYFVSLGLGALLLAVSTIFNIRAISYIQITTEKKLIGKVISYVMTLAMGAIPIGNLIYGYLFDVFIEKTGFVFLFTALITFGIAIYSKHIFKDLPEAE